MKKYAALFTCLLFLVAGCSNGNENNRNNSKTPKIIKVKLTLPETAKVNEEVKLSAKVSQGDELVKDADEVKFEIRKSGESDSEMIEVKKQNNGVYHVNKAFKEDGEYIVTSHVTARDMHSMPSKRIIVGTPKNTAEDHQQHDDGNEDAHEHHHHGGNVSIDFHTHEAKVNQAAVLTAHINNENQPLQKADVRFEVWKENEQKHEFLEAKEEGGGQYTLSKTFALAGTYQVRVHVEKNELHEHQEEEIVVK